MLQKTLSLLIALSLVIAPTANANTAAAQTVKELVVRPLKNGWTGTTRIKPGGLWSDSMYTVLQTSKLRAAGVAGYTTAKHKSTDFLIFLNSKGDEVFRAAFAPTAPQILSQYRPSKLKDWLIRIGTGTGRIAVSKLKHFPIEALTFGIAIGGITFYELLETYYKNPEALEQYIDGQMDPFGQFSFYLFMYASGMTSEPALEVFRNKALHRFLPYFGMSMGMMASHMSNDYFATPLMRDCVKKMLSFASDSGQVCDTAQQNFSKAWNTPEIADQKIREYKSALMGLFAATLASGVVSWGTSKVIQFVGVNLGLSLLPGGLFMKVPQLVGKFGHALVRNSNFMINMTWLEQPVHSYYVNALDAGPELKKTSMCVAAHFAKLGTELTYKDQRDLNSIFKYDCPATAAQDYQKLIETMARFRNENLSPVIMAQRNWESYLSELASHYRMTERFYQNVTDSVYNKLYINKPPQVSPLDVPSPLFGVQPLSDREFSWLHYLDDDITRLEQEQKSRVLTVSRELLKIYGTGKAEFDNATKDKSKEAPAPLSKNDLQYIKDIFDRLNTDSPQKMAEGIRMAIRAATPGLTDVTVNTFERKHLSDNGVRVMDYIVKALGAPSPKKYKGQGYLAAWLNNLERDQVGKQSAVPFPDRLEHVSTPTIPEYLVASMALGPEVRDSNSIREIIQVGKHGFRSEFHPPRLIPSGKVYHWSDVPRFDQRTGELANVFNNLIWIDSDKTPGCGPKKKECYKPMFDWIAQGFIRQEILPAPQNGVPPQTNYFVNWWEKNLKGPYMGAWNDFERQYEGVIKLFLHVFYGGDRQLHVPFTNIPIPWTRYFKNQKHGANESDAKNGVLANLNQERALALLILSRFVSPEYRPLRSKDFGRVLNQYNLSILRMANAQGAQWAPFLTTYEQKWQAATAKFLALKGPAQLMKAESDPGRKYQPRLSNQSIVEAANDLDATLNEIENQIKAQFGIAEDGATKVTPQLEMVALALGSLRASHSELKDYGLIVNSVSYVETHEDAGNPVFNRCLRTSDPSLNALRGEAKPDPNCP